MSKHYKRELSTSVTPEISKTEAKAKRGGKGDPFIEQRTKRDIFRKTGATTDESRTINREDNIYDKTIKDSKTGDEIYKCREPLDKHVGHGSAKVKKQTKLKQSNAEKPLSLKPLKFDEAVSDLLKVKPAPKKTEPDVISDDSSDSK
jgi:hypothetical protein